MHHHIIEGVPARFSLNNLDQVCITFTDDPAYVRSDKIIFDTKDSSLHAVLHETLHLIGHVDKKLSAEFAAKSEVLLSAPHYFSGTINLKTPLVISN